MEKPDYEFWSQQPEYKAWEAAHLCCDIEPRRWTRAEPEPAKVSSMHERIIREVNYRTTSRKSYPDNSRVQCTRTEKWFRQETLRFWAEETGQRAAMPFLFPEDRIESANDESGLRGDSKEAFLFLIGLLAHSLVEKGGSDLGTNDKPNKSGIVRAIKRQAENLGASTRGLSDSQLSERLKEALEEVKQRTPE